MTQTDTLAKSPPDNFLEPLILAENMFPALEDMVWHAQREILLSFRVFDPQTKLISDIARRTDLKTWGDLIAKKAGEGLSIRILLTDFEPMLTPDLHALAWRNVDGFLKALSGQSASNVQILCAQHEGHFSPLAQGVFWPMFVKALFGISGRIKGGDLDTAHLPGLRSYVTRAGKIKWKALLDPCEMNPATHHQKFAVVDARVAIVGGLDVNDRRFDDRHHTRPADETWQDLSVKVGGAVVPAIRTQFVKWWNNDCARNEPIERLKYVNPDTPYLPHAIPDCGHQAACEQNGASLLATRTQHQEGFWVIRPSPVELSLLDHVLGLIDDAETLIYIETQFLRHQPIAEALAAAATRNSDLQCIIVLPFAPEEVAFDKETHKAHQLGERLQVKCLDRIQSAFGPRCGVYGLVKNAPLEDDMNGRAAAYGSGVIHVHSKVMMVDDIHLMVSSANMNGRSLAWDTELGIALHDERAAKNLRVRLWKLHSHSAEFSLMDLDVAAERWRALAADNAAALPGERKGFVVPYKKAPARRFGAPAFYIPRDMV